MCQLPCQLSVLLLQPQAAASCPQSLGQGVSPQKGAGSTFSSLLCCYRAGSQQLSSCMGASTASVHPPGPWCPVLTLGMVSCSCTSAGTVVLCTQENPSLSHLKPHFKGCVCRGLRSHWICRRGLLRTDHGGPGHQSHQDMILLQHRDMWPPSQWHLSHRGLPACSQQEVAGWEMSLQGPCWPLVVRRPPVPTGWRCEPIG